MSKKTVNYDTQILLKMSSNMQTDIQIGLNNYPGMSVSAYIRTAISDKCEKDGVYSEDAGEDNGLD